MHFWNPFSSLTTAMYLVSSLHIGPYPSWASAEPWMVCTSLGSLLRPLFSISFVQIWRGTRYISELLSPIAFLGSIHTSISRKLIWKNGTFNEPTGSCLQMNAGYRALSVHPNHTVHKCRDRWGSEGGRGKEAKYRSKHRFTSIWCFLSSTEHKLQAEQT